MSKEVTLVGLRFGLVGGVACLLLVIISLAAFARQEYGALVGFLVFASMFSVWFGTLAIVVYSAVHQLNELPGGSNE